MSEETRRVLDLLAQGKITVDEADRLLSAIGPGSGATRAAAAEKGSATAEAPPPRHLRITITKTRSWQDNEGEHARLPWMWPGSVNRGSGEVTIRVPVGLVRSGVRLGAMIPGFARGGLQAHLRERGVDMDLTKFDADTIDRLMREFGEVNIDVVSDRGGKAHIRITAE